MDEKKTSIIAHVLTLAALIVILLSVVVHFKIVSCAVFTPVACDVYYSIIAGGSPKVLIVQGEEGLGDPDFLYDTLRGPHFSARISARELSVVSLPLLNEYQLVIVEKAKVMGIGELKMFQEYVTRGGKLIWIGDAGTQAPESESDQNYFLQYGQREEGGSGNFIGPWARRSGNRQVSHDVFLGVNYKANYCDLVDCDLPQYIGNFDFVDTDEQLVLGLAQNLAFYSDFAIVELNSDAYLDNLAFMNHGSDLIATPEGTLWLANEEQNFGNEFPVIIATGVGGRIAYYAFPPEFFVSNQMPLDEKTGERIAYWAMMENMYYGMLFK